MQPLYNQLLPACEAVHCARQSLIHCLVYAPVVGIHASPTELTSADISLVTDLHTWKVEIQYFRILLQCRSHAEHDLTAPVEFSYVFDHVSLEFASSI